MRIIVGMDLECDEAVVRFHVIRPTEQWLVDDLESYKDPILVIDC